MSTTSYQGFAAFSSGDRRRRRLDPATVVQFDGHSGAQPRQRLLVGLAADLDEIGLRTCELALVSFALARRHWSSAADLRSRSRAARLGTRARETRHQIHDGRAALWITDGSHVALGLVESEMQELLAAR